ncbi:MAG: hypothetical protein SPL08_05130 [Pseudomonadota bacterium]|nr:hypothetical protein [Pseudomonadota bacterium]
MNDADKKKIVEANARKKYIARDRRTFRRPKRSARTPFYLRDKAHRVAQEKKPLSWEEKQDLIKKISAEKDLDKSKELIKKAQEHNLKISEKILERIKKREKAREDMKHRINEMKKRSLSATEKDAIKQIQNGHADRAFKELRTSGRDGALGNEIADNSLRMAEDAKILAEGMPLRDSNSVMKKMLAEHSVPADTLYERKRDDKSDQNREGIKHKDSTQKQMTVAYMKKLRGEAYSG